MSQEEFFNKAVSGSYQKSYKGIVIKKYYNKDHGRDIIIIENKGFKRIFDLVYEKKELYSFIKINDTLIKEIKTNYLRIKRKNLDTILYLKFENIKGSDIYSNRNNLIEK